MCCVQGEVKEASESDLAPLSGEEEEKIEQVTRKLKRKVISDFEDCLSMLMQASSTGQVNCCGSHKVDETEDISETIAILTPTAQRTIVQHTCDRISYITPLYNTYATTTNLTGRDPLKCEHKIAGILRNRHPGTWNAKNTIVGNRYRTATSSFKVIIHNSRSRHFERPWRAKTTAMRPLPCARLVLLLGVLHAIPGAGDLRLRQSQLGLGGSCASRFLLTVLELSLRLTLLLLVLVCRRDDGGREGGGLCVDGLGGAEVGMGEGLGSRYAL